MITLVFACFLGLAAAIALVDWRRGWMLAIVVAVLQDPARKLTPGTPVVMTFSIVLVYLLVLFGAQRMLMRNYADFSRRFGRLYLAGALFFLFLILATFNGLMTYGIELWKVPALSLFIYCAPVPAVILGYAFVNREEALHSFFRFYAIVTSIALVGTVLEYFDAAVPGLGLVGLEGPYIRHLPGIQVRMLSGFYRAPDIMGWHAATLTSICIYMAVRRGLGAKSWPWIIPAAWGFLNCMISGRRKAVYMVVVYAAVVLWRYYRRLTVTQLFALGMMAVAVLFVLRGISSDEKSSVYTRGAATSRWEVWERIGGGVTYTIEQFGFMGAGLGTATQGVRHLLGRDQLGWQEGGLGKLTVELGVPGLLAAAFFAFVLFRTMFLISRYPDEPGSPQLLRVALFALITANVVNFLASAQAYSDAGLTLTTAFFLGSLFATARLSELPAAEAAAPVMQPATA
jgi:hypothetical protein